MSTTHVAWASIELLHNVVRTLDHLHALGSPFPVVDYRAKVKLHGESVAELETSGLSFAQVEKAILVRARTWYLSDTSR